MGNCEFHAKLRDARVNGLEVGRGGGGVRQ